MDHDHALLGQLAEAARSLDDRQGLPLTAQQAVDLAARLISGCDAAAITRVQGKRVFTIAETHPLAKAGDDLQYQFGEGPCLDALEEINYVRSDDLGEESRWPQWAPRAQRELGVRSMLSLRLFTADTTVGALNLYALQPHSFSEVSHLEGGTLAAQCAVAMASADTIDNLHVAVRHRTTIGQAQGILMERFSLEPDHAFAVLTRLSQDHNEKLYDLACRIVATRSVPGRAAAAG